MGNVTTRDILKLASVASLNTLHTSGKELAWMMRPRLSPFPLIVPTCACKVSAPITGIQRER